MATYISACSVAKVKGAGCGVCGGAEQRQDRGRGERAVLITLPRQAEAVQRC